MEDLVKIGAVIFALMLPVAASAQDRSIKAEIGSAIAKEALDPSTYAPAIFSDFFTRKDWKTSQPLFDRGFVEANPFYTVSGRPHDYPMSFEAGNRQITFSTLSTLGFSFGANSTIESGYRLLSRKYPDKKRLLLTLAWIARIGLNGYLSYTYSIQHFRQWERNKQMIQLLQR